MAQKGREKYLGAISIELKELDKLGCKYDQDELVETLKSMSHKESEQYGNKILAEEAKKYIEPIFAKYANDWLNAKGFEEFLDAVKKEQQAHTDLWNNYHFAVRAIDKQNGNADLSILTKTASQLSTSLVLSRLEEAVKHNLINPKDIMQRVHKDSGNIEGIYISAQVKCDSRNTALEARAIKRDKEQHREQEKEHENKIDRGFSM